MHKLAEKWKRVWCVHRRCCWRRRRAWAFEWRWGRSWGKLLRREVCGAPWQRDWSRPTAFCQVAYSPDPPFLFPSEIGWGRRRRRPSQLGLNDVTEPLTGSRRLGVWLAQIPGVDGRLMRADEKERFVAKMNLHMRKATTSFCGY